MSSKPKQRTYFYQPPEETPANTSPSNSSPTFVLDKQALELPSSAQLSLKSRGYFFSVTGALFTHRDARIAPAPTWLRLLSPTRSILQIVLLLHLLLSFRLNFFPLMIILFVGLDALLQNIINLDGEHCANVSTLSSLLSLSLLAAQQLSPFLTFVDQWLKNESSIISLTSSSSSSFTWTGALFPMPDVWSKLLVWPAGMVVGLLVLHLVYVRCTSLVWLVGWTSLGLSLCLYQLWYDEGETLEVYGMMALACVLGAVSSTSWE
jgi:hypothetical protein